MAERASRLANGLREAAGGGDDGRSPLSASKAEDMDGVAAGNAGVEWVE